MAKLPLLFSTIVLDNCIQIRRGKFGFVFKYNDTVPIKHTLCLSLDNSDESRRKSEDSTMGIQLLSALSDHNNIVSLRPKVSSYNQLLFNFLLRKLLYSLAWNS